MLKYYHVIQVIYYPIIGTIIELIGIYGILVFSDLCQKARENQCRFQEFVSFLSANDVADAVAAAEGSR